MRDAFVWLGALIFAVSLASFAVVYGYLLRVAAPITDEPVWPAVLINIALFTVFALHHSLMARTGAKAWITRTIPGDLERSAYVWVASLMFLAVCWLWQPLPGAAWIITGPLTWVMFATQLAGLLLTERAARFIGVWELAGVRQVSRNQAVEFKVTGPFGLVRHPIYLGWVLIVFAAPATTRYAVLTTANSNRL